MTILAIITPYVDSIITIAGLAFFASLQVGIFKRVRGVNYASFMMTGNITNTSLTVARAIDESDPKVLKQASYTIIIIFTFMVGVAASTWFAQYLHEYSLYTILLPLFILNYFLFIEAKEKRNQRFQIAFFHLIPAGFEPATVRLEGECSIQLSYGTNNSISLQNIQQHVNTL